MKTRKEVTELLGKVFIISDITYDFKDVTQALNRMLNLAAPGYEFMFDCMPESGHTAMSITLMFNRPGGE